MPDLNHRPEPGPSYWEWRCLVCSEPVRDHPSRWRRFLRWFDAFFHVDEDLYDPYPEDRP